jgi:uncharacterized protein YbjT (DUF2867 family)
MRALVIGGTGTVGRLTAAELLRRGHEVRVLSRGGGSGAPGGTGYAGDLETGAGLEAALDGVQCTLDCANAPVLQREAAVAFFEGTTRRVMDLAARAGVRHHVVLSIVGIDAVPTGYYAGKLAQERAALAGPVPATVLRATQFHEFVGQMLGRLRRGPLAAVPMMLMQPIAAREVAAALADVAESAPAGRAADIGGPRHERLADLARVLVRARRQRVAVVPLWVPGAAGRGMRNGALTLGDDGVVRGPGFREWLTAHGP